MDKVTRDDKVAVLYTNQPGWGWYTWNLGHKECLFNTMIVGLIEKGEVPTEALCKDLFGQDFGWYGAKNLAIKWVPKDSLFRVTENGGKETVYFLTEPDWTRA